MFRIFLLIFLAIPAVAKDCITFDQAPDYVGRTKCVTGKVLKVGQSSAGSMFLDFCEDYRKCPFVVIVFRSNLKDVGDVRTLEGKDVEITGKIKEWNDRAEIILKHAGQLDGMTEKLPPIPKTYDADKRGKYSAGTYSGPRSTHPTHKRTKQQPADDLDAE
jgi:hypothetical protein